MNRVKLMKRYTGLLFSIEQRLIDLLNDRYVEITFNKRKDLEIILTSLQTKIKSI